MGKTIAGGVAAAFVIFYIITSPDQAAHIAQGIGHLIAGAGHLVSYMAHGLGRFINKLSS